MLLFAREERNQFLLFIAFFSFLVTVLFDYFSVRVVGTSFYVHEHSAKPPSNDQ
jgi:hypothetical protein